MLMDAYTSHLVWHLDCKMLGCTYYDQCSGDYLKTPHCVVFNVTHY